MTTTFDIDEIARLLAAATPGEYIAHGWGDGSTLDGVTNVFNADAEVLLMECIPVADAALIITLHNSAPAMIAELRELRAENARLREVVKHYADTLCEGIGECVGDFCGMLSSNECGGCFARAALGEPQ